MNFTYQLDNREGCAMKALELQWVEFEKKNLTVEKMFEMSANLVLAVIRFFFFRAELVRLVAPDKPPEPEYQWKTNPIGPHWY